ncbi:MAG: hypothetical protein KC635_24100, partial [Myxococcales bacterium]|nr:hypothetical protein [Myxococcales bacterium]
MRVGTTLWLASFVFASLALGLAACGDGGTKATCDDGARNGAETGVDCGGGCGVACPVGQGCDGPSDCLSGVCSTVNLCACGPGTVANASGGCDAVDPCGNAPCKNGGTCAAVGTGFSCTCAAGWSGDTCTTNVDDCAPSPCENGGVCVDGVDGYTCTCAAGYYGDTCGSACEVGNCAAGTVTCDADGTNRQCGACQAGWTGTTCADDDDECATGHDDCDEHAICANTVPGFTCTCEAGYDGDGASCAPCADGTWG